MTTETVLMVRVYLTEGDKLLKRCMALLHDERKVRGVTVLRGVTGFGANGHVHSSSLIDVFMDLPLVLEFFDTPDRAREAISGLREFIKPGHIVSWSAELEVEAA
ncbi:MAG: DUF190 domain-containing protein [Gammaproteobacteria bacterium]